MKAKSITLSLPIKDMGSTKEFWTKLGFIFDEQFSDDKSLALVLNEGSMYAMLITHDYFKTFTNRSVSDNSTTQVIIAIEVDSKESVDELVLLALENGGTRYRESADHGWMYLDSFADPDGHQWEIVFSDPTWIPEE